MGSNQELCSKLIFGMRENEIRNTWAINPYLIKINAYPLENASALGCHGRTAKKNVNFIKHNFQYHTYPCRKSSNFLKFAFIFRNIFWNFWKFTHYSKAFPRQYLWRPLRTRLIQMQTISFRHACSLEKSSFSSKSWFSYQAEFFNFKIQDETLESKNS